MSRIATKFIKDNAVTNAKLAQMSTLTIKGNNTGGTANAADLTVAQTLTLLGIRSGKTAITISTTSQAVTFSSTLGSTGYSVTATITNVTDSLPQFQPVVISAQAATGFTASWNAPVSSGNYVLSWQAIVNN